MQRLNFMTYKTFITPWKITLSHTINVSFDMSKVQNLYNIVFTYSHAKKTFQYLLVTWYIK